MVKNTTLKNDNDNVKEEKVAMSDTLELKQTL